MADTVEQFFKGTISQADVANGATVEVLATDANTRAVIRNVVTANPISGGVGDLDLKIDDFKVATVGADPLSGQEIIHPSASVTLSTPSIIARDRELQFFDDAENNAYRIKSPIIGAAKAPMEETSAVTTQWSPWSNFRTGAVDATGTFFVGSQWDGNSGQHHHKYEIGVGQVATGTVTSYGPLGTVCDDGYLYWAYSNQIYRMKIDDNSASERFGTDTMTNYAQTTYPFFGTNAESHPDGTKCFVCRRAYNSTMSIAYFTAAGEKISETDLGSSTQHAQANYSSSQAGTFYDTDAAAWKFWIKDSNSTDGIGVYDAAFNQLAVATSGLGFKNTFSLPVAIGNRLFFIGSDNSIYSVAADLTDKRLEENPAATPWDYSLSYTGSPAPDAGTIAGRTYAGLASTDVRITGVQST